LVVLTGGTCLTRADRCVVVLAIRGAALDTLPRHAVDALQTRLTEARLLVVVAAGSIKAAEARLWVVRLPRATRYAESGLGVQIRLAGTLLAGVCRGVDEPWVDARLTLPGHDVPELVGGTRCRALLRRRVVQRTVSARRAGTGAGLAAWYVDGAERTRLAHAVVIVLAERAVLAGSRLWIVDLSLVRTELTGPVRCVVKLRVGARLAQTRLQVEELRELRTRVLAQTCLVVEVLVARTWQAQSCGVVVDERRWATDRRRERTSMAEDAGDND